MKLSIHEAEARFSTLVAAVEAGEKAVICRDGRPVIECIPARSPQPFPFGAWKDLIPAGAGLAHLVDPPDPRLLDHLGL